MRILHTSDWHLGRSFGPVSLHAEQAAFLDWLVGVVVAERVDLVVVAGDLYDRAIPPTESVALLRDTLDRLVAHHVRVVAIAGNHDGPERVAAYDGLTDRSGVIVRGGFGRAGAVTTLELDDGPLDVVAVPYLDPVLTPPGWADGPESAEVAAASVVPVSRPASAPPITGPDEPPSLFDLLVDDEPEPVAAGPSASSSRRTHHCVLDQALRRARAARRAPRGIVVAHAFVSGAVASESERLLTVGGTAEVGVELFAGFDYVALGHLHRPQRVTRRRRHRPLLGHAVAVLLLRDPPQAGRAGRHGHRRHHRGPRRRGAARTARRHGHRHHRRPAGRPRSRRARRRLRPGRRHRPRLRRRCPGSAPGPLPVRGRDPAPARARPEERVTRPRPAPPASAWPPSRPLSASGVTSPVTSPRRPSGRCSSRRWPTSPVRRPAHEAPSPRAGRVRRLRRGGGRRLRRPGRVGPVRGQRAHRCGQDHHLRCHGLRDLRRAPGRSTQQ